MYRNYGKRCVDIIGASLALAIACPVILATALCLALTNNGRIFFRQQRPGLHGRPFWILKFKTMTDACDAQGVLLPDERRLTRIGRFVRSLSFDELLQLVNVIKGDMSLIGPRPLLMEYLPLYSPEQARRHEVKPGITGLAQVNGRNLCSWEERFQHDVKYVDSLSWKLDLKILLQTVITVLTRRGIGAENSLIKERFRGSGDEAHQGRRPPAANATGAA